jgi:hypothetical protein
MTAQMALTLNKMNGILGKIHGGSSFGKMDVRETLNHVR